MTHSARRLRPGVRIDLQRRRFMVSGLGSLAALAGCGGGGGTGAATPAPVLGTLELLAGAMGEQGHVDGPAALARFDSPLGLAADAQGNLYVADHGINAIRKIAPDGTVSTLTVAGSGLWAPRAVAVSRDGQVYATGQGEVVSRITADGLAETLAGSFQQPGFCDGVGVAAQFSGAAALAIDARDRLYVFDSNGTLATLRTVTPEGRVTTIGGPDFWSIDYGGVRRNAVANALALSPRGDVFVADNYSVVRELSVDGELRIVAGAYGDPLAAPGRLPAHVGVPTGLAVLPSGQLAIASLNAQCIFVTRNAVF